MRAAHPLPRTQLPPPRLARAPPPLPPRATTSTPTSSSPVPPPPGQDEFLASPALPSAWPTPAYNRYRLPVNVTRSVAAAWEADTGAKDAVAEGGDVDAAIAAVERDGIPTKPPPPPLTLPQLLAWLPQFLRFVVLPEQVRFAAVEVARWLGVPVAAAFKKRWVLFAAAVDARTSRSNRAPLAVALDRWHGRIGVVATVKGWVGVGRV